MEHQELFSEFSAAENALRRAIEALIQANERYCTTFPQSVKDGLPSYAEAKSNASAAYYIYATALTYVLQSVEGTLAKLSPLSEEANKAHISELPERCNALILAYEQFSSDALSPYFEESQRIIHGSGETISLTPLYQATREFSKRCEEFLKQLA